MLMLYVPSMTSCLPELTQSTKQRMLYSTKVLHFLMAILLKSQQIQFCTKMQKKNGNCFENALKSQHLFCFKASNGFTIESAMILL